MQALFIAQSVANCSESSASADVGLPDAHSSARRAQSPRCFFPNMSAGGLHDDLPPWPSHKRSVPPHLVPSCTELRPPLLSFLLRLASFHTISASTVAHNGSTTNNGSTCCGSSRCRAVRIVAVFMGTSLWSAPIESGKYPRGPSEQASSEQLGDRARSGRRGKSPAGVGTAMTLPFSMADMIGLTPVELQV